MTSQSRVSDAAESEADQLMAELRTLLLKQERARVAELDDEVNELEAEIERLKAALHTAETNVIPSVKDQFGEITSHAVTHNRSEVAKALGPIIGDATRVQIQESKEEMIEVLYPVIGDSVVRAVSERLRALQRQIDAQVNRINPIENVRLRLQGLDPAEVALRRSLPFELQQLFLIQHETGMLIAHHVVDESDSTDSDLMSGMLTAIRDFSADSLDPGNEDESELNEIQYGDRTILLQNGTTAYIAAVVTGIPPAGFRDALRALITDLHLQYHAPLTGYDGDPEPVAAIPPALSTWEEAFGAEHAGGDESKASQDTRLLRNIGILIGAVALVYCCAQVAATGWLMAQVLNPDPTPTAQIAYVTVVSTPTLLPPTATSTHTPTATATVTPTATSTSTSTSTPTPTATFTATPTNTPTLIPTQTSWQTIAPLWTREEPDFEADLFEVIPVDQLVEILEAEGDWLYVQWVDQIDVTHFGWVPAKWVSITESDTIGDE